jgi:hypothetical protein
MLEQHNQNIEAARKARGLHFSGGGSSPNGQPSHAADSLDDLLHFVTQQGAPSAIIRNSQFHWKNPLFCHILVIRFTIVCCGCPSFPSRRCNKICP